MKIGGAARSVTGKIRPDMATAKNPAEQITSPLLREAMAYWRSARHGADRPNSADFLDSMPPRLAPQLMVFDVLPEDVLVRFHGSALVVRRGQDHTGRSWLQANSDLRGPAVLRNVWGVIDHTCGLITEAHFITSTRRLLVVDALSLPLAAAPERPPRMANISVSRDSIAFDERTTGWHGPITASWVDLGFGIPPFPPMPIS